MAKGARPLGLENGERVTSACAPVEARIVEPKFMLRAWRILLQQRPPSAQHFLDCHHSFYQQQAPALRKSWLFCAQKGEVVSPAERT